MKYDVEKKDELIKEQAPPVEAPKAPAPPDRRCEDRVRYLEAILHDMEEGVIVADRNGDVEYMNPVAMDLFGLRTNEEATRYFRDAGRYEVVDAAGRPLPRESWPLARAARGETFRDQEILFKDKATGREIPGIYDAAPLRVAGGKPDLNVITVHARTAKKAAMGGVMPGLLPLLGLISASVPEAIMATGCDVLLYDDRNGVFRSTAASSEWLRTATEKKAYCASEEDKAAYARRVMESRTPLIVEGTKDHPLCSAPGSLAGKLGVKTVIALPLIDKGRYLGAMIVESTLARKQLGDQSMEILNAVARLAAAMIARAEAAPAAAAA